MPDIAAFRMLRQEDRVVKDSIGYFTESLSQNKDEKRISSVPQGRILLEILLSRQKGKFSLAIKYLKISEYIRHSPLAVCFSAISS